MHVVIRTFELDDLAAAHEIKRHVDERFIPMLKDVPGFVAYYWVDTKEGTIVAVALFDEREGAEESTKRAMEYIAEVEGVSSLLPNTPQIMMGEVGVYEHNLDKLLGEGDH
jgi:hypothetical protein